MSPSLQPRYRGRIAPSPTGLLHLGHARTFWTAYQRALAAGGTLVLRNEDLDPQRSKPEFVAATIEDLHWLGIRWQEGPDVGGDFGPYAQSQRQSLYRNAWERLRADGWIYPCRCSRKDLARMASAPHEGDTTVRVEDPTSQMRDVGHPRWSEREDEFDPPRRFASTMGHPHSAALLTEEVDDEPVYPGTCRPAVGSVAWAANPAGVHWRFRVPDGEAVAFEDGNLGPRRFIAGRDFGDFLVWRRDDVPAYQLAVIGDDAAMQITEVVRGADLLKSTARQILLNRALGHRDPAWFHCELLRDEHGRRLAKRYDALSLRALRVAGYEPETLLSNTVSDLLR